MLRELCLSGVVLALAVGLAVFMLPFPGDAIKSKISTRLSWLSALFSLLSAVFVAWRGPFSLIVVGTHAHPAIGLLANRFTVTLLLLISVVGAVIQTFSVRYLQAEQNAARFFAGADAVTISMAIVATSITVTVLSAAWILAGAAFVAVIRYRPDLPGVKESARRTMKAFVFGDTALLVASVIVFMRMGNVDLAAVPRHISAANTGFFADLIAVLIVVAALTRSAQGFLGRWLPDSIAAPTPVSALLHAGVVNGGGILLIRLSVVTGNSLFAMSLAFAVAMATATVANALMGKKADVKGSLAFSTMGQMGFMIAECSVGLYLAAVIHLIGHAMYKATLFFGSGSQISAAKGISATSAPLFVRVPSAALTAAATAGVATLMGGLADQRGLPLILFVAVTAASAAWSWWSRRPASFRIALLGTALFVLLGACYGLMVGGLGRWIAPALPAAGSGTLDARWLLSLAVAGFAVAVLLRISPVRIRAAALLLDMATPSLGRRKGAGKKKEISYIGKQDIREPVSAYAGDAP